MTEQYQPLNDRQTNDSYHLKLLSIFHLINAGFAFLALLLLVSYYLVLKTFISEPVFQNSPGQISNFPGFFGIFEWLYLILAVLILVSHILNFQSALFIKARKRRIFSLIVAGINCFNMPLGTLLGVFTIAVLVRDSVRKLYEA